LNFACSDYNGVESRIEDALWRTSIMEKFSHRKQLASI
jgi:hypothetical protein